MLFISAINLYFKHLFVKDIVWHWSEIGVIPCLHYSASSYRYVDDYSSSSFMFMAVKRSWLYFAMTLNRSLIAFHKYFNAIKPLFSNTYYFSKANIFAYWPFHEKKKKMLKAFVTKSKILSKINLMVLLVCNLVWISSVFKYYMWYNIF